MVNTEPIKHVPPGIQDWELKFIADFAKWVERSEPEELAAELARQLLVLKSHPPEVSDWRAYLSVFLKNRFLNWRRNRRRREQRHVVIDPVSPEDTLTKVGPPVHRRPSNSDDYAIGSTEFREMLAPKLRRLWDLLGQRKFTRVAAARRLRKSRNTIRVWVQSIQRALIAYANPLEDGFPEGLSRPRPVRVDAAQPRRSRHNFVPVSLQLLKTLAGLRLSGTQWRILIKVFLETARYRRRAVPFTWYAMARDLGINREGLRRAALNLMRRRLIFVHEGRIALDRKITRRRHVA